MYSTAYMAGPEQKPLRLLMTADTLGGVWTYAIDLIKGLQPFGIKVHLATMGKPLSASQRREAAALHNLWVHESSFQLEWMDNPWEEVEKAGDWLISLEEEIQPDIIHLNNYCHGDYPWQAPVLMVGHSCVLSWWQAVKGEMAPERYHTYAMSVREGLKSADRVVAPTTAFMEDLQRLYGPFEKSAVVANARRKDRFYATKKENFILSMGRLWDEAKNISAFENIAGSIDWPLEVAGPAKHPSGGKNADYQNLKFLGELDAQTVRYKLSQAAIYALPARYEPFGLSVLEAGLSACALVLGDIPSLRENWEGAALFANPDDPEELKDKLNHLIKRPRLCQRMGGLARQKAMKFDIHQQAAQYLQHYQQLLARRAGNHQQSAPRTAPAEGTSTPNPIIKEKI